MSHNRLDRSSQKFYAISDNRVFLIIVRGTYKGDRLNDVKHGKGKKLMDFVRSESDEPFSGEEEFPDKSSYTGEFENGLPHGQGSCVRCCCLNELNFSHKNLPKEK